MKALIQELFKNKMKRTIVINAFCLVWGFVKIGIGVVLSSPFFYASAGFTFSLILTNAFALLGMRNDKEMKEKKYLFFSGLFLAIAGLAYSLYNIRLLKHQLPMNFGLVISITIAAFSFVYLGFCIYDICHFRHKNRYEKVISLTSLVSALCDIMLTQMSFLIYFMSHLSQRYNLYLAFSIGIFAMALGIDIIFFDFFGKKTTIHKE